MAPCEAVEDAMITASISGPVALVDRIGRARFVVLGQRVGGLAVEVADQRQLCVGVCCQIAGMNSADCASRR